MPPVLPTYFTSSDSAFYPGTVALVNSLRLTGHAGEIVVFDLGLSEEQRQRLSAVSTIQSPVGDRDNAPKVLPPSTWTRGPVVVLDSDMLIVASLNDVLNDVARGKICLFPDPDERWFDEWSTGFALRAPLRRQRYANSGFVAFSVEKWPGLLERWAEANGQLPLVRSTSAEDPFRDVDQDALNALLMSEFPADAVSMQPRWAQAHADEMIRVLVKDERGLTCMFDECRVTVLHHSLRPKAWERTGWQRDSRQAYVRLLPRVLCGHDVPLRLEPDELPFWLRPTLAGRLASRGLAIARDIPGAKRVVKAAISATRIPSRRRSAGQSRRSLTRNSSETDG
jgi:hypothetical protein